MPIEYATVPYGQEHLDALIELVADIVLIVMRVDGRIRGANTAALTAYGYSRQEVLSLSVQDLRTPETRGDIARQLADADATGARFETVHRRKDGTTFPVEVSSRGATLSGERILVSVVRDISERVRFQAALQESELRFRSAFEQAVVGIADVGLDGRWLRVNGRICDILGLSREELLEKDFYGLTCPDDIEIDLAGSPPPHSAGGPPDFACEKLFVRKDRSRVWVFLRSSLIRGSRGEPLYIGSTWEDITSRKTAAEQLELVKTSIDRAPMSAYWLTPEGRIVYVNDAGCRSVGYSRDELLRMRVEEVMPMATPARWEEVFRSIKTEGLISMESAHRCKDGLSVPVQLTASYFQNGGREYCLAFAIDITDRLRTRRERDSLQAQLNQAQKLESVGRLADGLAHDFNNMLTIIQVAAQQALEHVDQGLPLQTELNEIRDAAASSAELTRQLLAFARKQTITPRVLDLNETVRGMLNMLRRLLGENLQLVWHPTVGLWPVLMDPSQLDQVLANLCVNARDAIADAGKVTLELFNKTVDQAFCAGNPGFVPGDYVQIRVSDDGRGTEPQSQPSPLEPVVTAKGDDTGVGLGLATVYGIVKQNNGFLYVCNAPRQAATFTIYLPRHLSKSEQPRIVESRPKERGRETVLVVEDDLVVLRLLTRLLEEQGYTVLPTSTPGEAFRIARKHAQEIHLLVADIVMPEMNGRDLAKNILSLHPRMKCLFMSGHTADVVAHHGVLDTGISFIHKPFTIDALTSKVRSILNNG